MTGLDGFLYFVTMALLVFILWNHDRRLTKIRQRVEELEKGRAP
jgi:hypothetical protein